MKTVRTEDRTGRINAVNDDLLRRWILDDCSFTLTHVVDGALAQSRAQCLHSQLDAANDRQGWLSYDEEHGGSVDALLWQQFF